MEGLNKQQLVLLALLVSFVTSIATGIVTVSLMERAPKAVTQTINRVVERTVERVVPAENQKAAVATKETIVVRSDDLAVAAIEKNSKNLIRIKRIDGAGDKRTETLLGIGLIVSKDGTVAADSGVLARNFDEYGSPIPRSFLGSLYDGSVAELQVLGTDEENGISLFEIKQLTDSKTDFSIVDLGNSDSLKLGQTVISLGGVGDDAVGTGIIANLAHKESQDRQITAIYTDREASSAISGTLLLNLSGEVIGANAGVFQADKRRYLPSNILRTSIDKIKSSLK
jgi:S1-C subfamily serine protease